MSFKSPRTLFIQSEISLTVNSESDDLFQDHHQEIGRLSGGASRVAVTQAPIVRQPSISTTRITQPVRGGIIWNAQGSQNRRDSNQPKKNRITLAVIPHTPAPEAQIESAPAPVPVPITQPLLTSASPSVGVHNSFHDRDRHGTLMAQVAAERQASGAAVHDSDSLEPSVPAEIAPLQPSAPSLGSPLAALSSPTLTQVVAPPAITHSAARQPIAAADTRGTEFAEQPEEQIEAPTFQHVLSHGCPRKGVFSWENKDHCDRYYMCTNGTFTEEACPNGLSYGQMGAVYQHCAYNWNIDCAHKKAPGPISSPGCPWQFGIFPVTGKGQCSIDYFVCEWGVPETKRCQPEGLFYDDRIKGCQWADQLGCKSESLLKFKCPPEDEDNPFWPYPRYYHDKQDIIVCVNEQPRLVHCTEEQIVDPNSLSCLDLKKKKKKL